MSGLYNERNRVKECKVIYSNTHDMLMDKYITTNYAIFHACMSFEMTRNGNDYFYLFIYFVF